MAALLDARAIWFGVPFVLALALGVPFVVADAGRFWAAMGELAHSMQFGQGELNPENGWLHHLTQSLRYGVGLPLLLTGMAGAIALSVRQPTTAALLFAFPAAYFAVAGSFGNLFFRYMIPIVPFLVVGGGVVRDDGSPARHGSGGRRWRWSRCSSCCRLRRAWCNSIGLPARPTIA